MHACRVYVHLYVAGSPWALAHGKMGLQVRCHALATLRMLYMCLSAAAGLSTANFPAFPLLEPLPGRSLLPRNHSHTIEPKLLGSLVVPPSLAKVRREPSLPRRRRDNISINFAKEILYKIHHIL